MSETEQFLTNLKLKKLIIHYEYSSEHEWAFFGDKFFFSFLKDGNPETMIRFHSGSHSVSIESFLVKIDSQLRKEILFNLDILTPEKVTK